MGTWKRTINIHYVQHDPRFVSSDLMMLERNLASLPDCKISQQNTLGGGSRSDEVIGSQETCDLYILAAHNLDSKEFKQWMSGVITRFSTTHTIWTPALILARVSFADLNAMLNDAVASNWYFDVVNPDHAESLPIRVANLVRMHDHLKELYRYEEAVNELVDRTEKLERALQKLSSPK